MNWTRLLVGFVALPLVAGSAAAQATGRITGTTTEAGTGQPVPQVQIQVVGTSLGTQSNATGQFSLAAVPAGTFRIRATRIGFTPAEDTVTVRAGQASTVTLALRPASVTLQEMVVVGYGTQRRSDLTGAVSSVTPNVERTPITSLEQTLQGTAPGVQVTQASAAPGGGISIRIRGGSSVTGSNEPLYVIDGFPVENDASSGNVTDGGRENTAPANPLAALNPNDIASIEILKDASATAIYGARGANGVVIITTKRGVAGRPRVTVDAYTGVQNVAKRYDLLNARQFAEFANEWAAAQPNAVPVPYPDLNAIPAGTDWQDAIFRQAPIYNMQLGVSGGTSGDNATRYALSGGVFQQDGVVHGSDFRRLSLRANLDQAVGSRLRLSSNVLLSRVNSSMVPTDGTFNAGAGAVGAAIQYIPLLPVRQPNGAYTLHRDNTPAELVAAGVSSGNVPNPVSMAFDVQDRLADTRALANAAGELTLLEGLALRVSVGTDLSNRSRDTYYPTTVLMGLAPTNGRAIRGRNENTSFLNENTLSFARRFADMHDVNAVVGYTRQTQNSVQTRLQNTNFVTDVTGYDNVGSGAGTPTVSSGRTRWTLASYLGRVNYTLLDRYLFTATGRYDGSSRFGTNNQWGFFPSFAFGWRLSDEPFMQGLPHVDQIKLRASWGQAGNPSISPYQSVSRLAAESYSFGGAIVGGFYPASIGNPNLGWETTSQVDIGADIGLFDSRVELTADWYDKRTDDLLLETDVPSETGFTSAFVNAGAVRNRGFELAITLRPLVDVQETGRLAWTTSFNYARNRNEVLSLGDTAVTRIFATSSIAPDLGSPGSLVQIGRPIGVFYGYQTEGLYRSQAEIDAHGVRPVSGTFRPGNVRFVDQDGNGIINPADRVIIGDPNPDYTIGWQNTIGFRGFELTALLDGTFGNDVLNLNLYRSEGGSPQTNISVARFFDRWTPENPNASNPRIGDAPGAVGADFTDRVLEDGSYIRLRTVTLSRELPSSWIGGIGLGSARAYVTGQNLWTQTDYSGFNPDVSSQGVGNLNRGIDLGAYPLARTFTFGLNFSY